MNDNKISKGAICAEIFSVCGAKRAADFAQEVGLPNLLEKIQRGEFTPPAGGFNAARAQARAAIPQTYRKVA